MQKIKTETSYLNGEYIIAYLIIRELNNVTGVSPRDKLYAIKPKSPI